MPISLNSRARREVNRAAADYDGNREGLGDDFLVEFQKALDIVEAHGAAMALWRGDVRVVRLNRFPYGIFLSNDWWYCPCADGQTSASRS